MTSGGNMGLCHPDFQPYLKVFITTIISFGGISGIYSFLSKSGKLELLSNSTNVNLWGDKSYDGIYCRVGQTPPSANPFSQKLDCNPYAILMSNNITMNPSWDCHTRLSYDNLFVFENQHFSLIFGFLIMFAFISAFFTVIHDWRLIKHRRDLSKMTEWFPNDDDSKLFDYICCWKYCESKNRNGSNSNNSISNIFDTNHYKTTAKCCNCSCIIIVLLCIAYICCLPFIVSLAVLQAIIIPFAFIFLRPFFCCSQSSWQEFKKFNGNLCKISYFWIGFAKFGLMIMSIILTFYGFRGFNVYLTTWQVEPYCGDLCGTCKCYCHYVLPSTNFYGLMIVTYLLTFNILSFLYQHSCKSMRYKLDYLLTKKYIQPLNYHGDTLQILRENPMQTILYTNKKYDEDVYDGMDDDGKDVDIEPNMSINGPEKWDDVLLEVREDNRKALSCMYGTMLVLGVLLMIFFTAMGFIAIGVSNANHWPDWVAKLTMWIGIVIVSIFIICCIFLYVCRCKK